MNLLEGYLEESVRASPIIDKVSSVYEAKTEGENEKKSLKSAPCGNR